MLRKFLKIKIKKKKRKIYMNTHNPTTEKTIINDSSSLFYWHMYVFINKI